MFYIRARKTWTHYHVGLDHVSWALNTPRRIHHTGGPKPRKNTVAAEKELLQDTERYHVVTRGYRAIAYGYLIMPSGRVYEGRGFEKQGAHTLGHNEDIGICFPGDYNNDKVTKRQKVAYRALALRLRMKGCSVGRAYPHHASFPTSCPGKNVCKEFGLDG